MTLTFECKRQECAEAMRRRIKARYPILRDGAILRADGRHGGMGFAQSVLKQASSLVQGRELQPGRIHSPVFVRSVIEVLDQTPHRGYRMDPQVVLVEITPTSLHSYWNAPAAAVRAARDKLGVGGRDAVAVLRFYDQADDSCFDIEVTLEDERCDIKLWSADRSYVAELGLRAQDNSFVAIASSNSATLPRNEPGTDDSICFRDVPANHEALLLPATPSLFVQPRTPVIVRPGDRDWPLRDLDAESRIAALYRDFLIDGPRVLHNAEPIRRRPESILKAEYESRRIRIKSQDGKAEPRPRLSITLTRLDEPQPVRTEESLTYPPVIARQIEMVEARASRLCREAIRISDADTLQADACDDLASAGIEFKAELVLKGRVAPGKKLRIGGRLIQTEPDGSFRVSCVVLDGKLHVPIEAVVAEAVVARQDFSINLGN